MITGAQLRMARAAVRLGVRDLARLAQISPTTVTRAEADLPVNKTIIAAIERALESAGIEFIPENGGGPGVRLKVDFRGVGNQQ
jgi:hypothetical protein